MAEDKRQIVRGIRMSNEQGKSELVTDADRLEELATKDQIRDFQEKGYLAGDWGTRRSAAKKEAASEPTDSRAHVGSKKGATKRSARKSASKRASKSAQASESGQSNETSGE